AILRAASSKIEGSSAFRLITSETHHALPPDLGQLRPCEPRPPGLAELDLCRFERWGVAVHAHVRWRAKNAGDRPEPLEIRGRATLFVDPAHGKFATEDRVIPAIFVRRRAEAGRAKRQTRAAVLRLAGERSPRAGRQHAQVMLDRSQRRSPRALHLRNRSAHAAAPTSFAARSRATSARRAQSALRRACHNPPGMSRRSRRTAEPMEALDRGHGPGHRPSLVPARRASASDIPNFGSGRRSPGYSPIVPVVRSR